MLYLVSLSLREGKYCSVLIAVVTVIVRVDIFGEYFLH